MSSWIDFKDLRTRLDFGAVLRHYGVTLNVKGQQHNGFCPLPGHPGKKKSPSFSANLPRGIWQCFGCGAKGNVLDFAVRMEGKNPDNSEQFRQAALVIQEHFFPSSGSKTPDSTGNKGAGKTTEAPAPAKPTAKEPVKTDERPHRINTPLDFELKGLDPNHPYLLGRGFTAETIENFGLGYCSRGLMKGRVAIPLHDRDGWLIGYAGRLVDEVAMNADNPKYRFPSDRERDGVVCEFRKSVFVYHAHTIEEPLDDLVVVEGFPAVWWLWQNGYTRVAALMGAACSAEQAAILVDLVKPTGRVWVFPDGDEAGERCAASVLTQVAPYRFTRWVRLDRGQQPTDCTAEDLADLLGTSGSR